MIRIAIVILNWNGRHYLEKFLPTVCRYSIAPGNQVFVVDNGSTDDSVTWVKTTFPETVVIEFPENYGFAPGYRKALELIEAQYFVLLNSDVEVTAGWLEPLAAAMDADPKMGACMPRMRSYHSPQEFEYAGAAGGFIDVLGYPFCRGRLLSRVETDTGQYENRRRIFWATGACMFVRSEAYFSADGLDGDFFAHMEEIDLCWRLHRIGYTLEVVPESIVYHVGGGTLPNNNPHKLFLNYRNNLYLLFKNLPAGRLIPVLFIRMLLDGVSAMVYLLSGAWGFFWAVPRAHFAFYRHIPTLIRKRLQLKSAIGTASRQEIYPGSILWDFFVRRKKTFDQLGW
jgi:GT2 family glycosyltransferase